VWFLQVIWFSSEIKKTANICTWFCITLWHMWSNHTLLYKKKKKTVTNVVPYFYFFIMVVGPSLSEVFSYIVTIPYANSFETYQSSLPELYCWVWRDCVICVISTSHLVFFRNKEDCKYMHLILYYPMTYVVTISIAWTFSHIHCLCIAFDW
jgi:hypothetical protein